MASDDFKRQIATLVLADLDAPPALSPIDEKEEMQQIINRVSNMAINNKSKSSVAEQTEALSEWYQRQVPTAVGDRPSEDIYEWLEGGGGDDAADASNTGVPAHSLDSQADTKVAARARLALKKIAGRAGTETPYEAEMRRIVSTVDGTPTKEPLVSSVGDVFETPFETLMRKEKANIGWSFAGLWSKVFPTDMYFYTENDLVPTKVGMNGKLTFQATRALDVLYIEGKHHHFKMSHMPVWYIKDLPNAVAYRSDDFTVARDDFFTHKSGLHAAPVQFTFPDPRTHTNVIWSVRPNQASLSLLATSTVWTTKTVDGLVLVLRFGDDAQTRNPLLKEVIVMYESPNFSAAAFDAIEGDLAMTATESAFADQIVAGAVVAHATPDTAVAGPARIAIGTALALLRAHYHQTDLVPLKSPVDGAGKIAATSELKNYATKLNADAASGMTRGKVLAAHVKRRLATASPQKVQQAVAVLASAYAVMHVADVGCDTQSAHSRVNQFLSAPLSLRKNASELFNVYFA